VYKEEIPLLREQIELLKQQAAEIQKAADARAAATPPAGPSGVLGTVPQGPGPQQGPVANADQYGAMLTSNTPPLVQSLNTQIADLEKQLKQAQTAMQQLDTSWGQWRTQALSGINQVSNQLTTGLNGWISGHERFGKAAAQMWNGLVMTGLQALERMAANFIAQHLRMLLIKRTTDQGMVVSSATSASQEQGIETAHNLKSVVQQAKTAAAKSFNWASEWGGPIAGAIAAAVTFAAVMAFAAFAEGGRVDSRAHAPRLIAYSGGGDIAPRSVVGAVRGPGTGTSDQVPILASNGEHMMTARATSTLGQDTMDAINRDPEKMAAVIRRGSVPALSEGGRVERQRSFSSRGSDAAESAPAFAGGGQIVARSMLGSGGLQGMQPRAATDVSNVVNVSNVANRAPDALSPVSRDAGESLSAVIQRGVAMPAIAQPAPYSSYGFRVASGAEQPGKAEGDTHNFNHTTNINGLQALDGASVRAALEEHGDLIGRIAVGAMKRHIRTGGVM
jgi:hypothetical protein